MQTLAVRADKLLWGGKVVESLAKKYGTPLYIYDEKILVSRIKELAAGPWEIHYAVKANPSPEILKILLHHNIGIDAVSANEVDWAISLGFDPKKIVFTSSSLSVEEAKRVIKKKVLVNLNSTEEIEIYGKIAAGTNIGIRINPQIKAGHHRHVQTSTEISKFGILLSDVEKAVETANKYNLKITMVHFHIGSGILVASLFIRAFENVLKILEKVDLPDLTHINLGGGFGTPYHPKEKRLDLPFLIDRISELHNKFQVKTGQTTKLVIEPGRYLVAESGILVTKVNTVSKNDYQTFYRVDSGFNHLLRPTLYGAYHHFINASKIKGKKERVVLSGNICEAGDILNSYPREVTKAKEGDKIAILDVGAYGISMGMEIYNLRGLPAEIIIKRNGKTVKFADHQSLKDILRRYK